MKKERTEDAPPGNGDVRMGFVYQKVPHITLRAIANNKAIDEIWERHEKNLIPLREQLSALLGLEKTLEEWEVPRELPADWPTEAKSVHAKFWRIRIARQKEIDADIAAKADHEFLYDKPIEDKNIVRVAGPFTVESLSPHRMLTADEDGDFVDPALEKQKREDVRRMEVRKRGESPDFVAMILENLRAAGVQQVHKEDKIEFSSLEVWPGKCIAAEGICSASSEEDAGDVKQRAAIFIGPEYGTVSRVDIAAAAKEAMDGSFDVLVVCAFNYDAQVSDLSQIGRLPILKARMNADLHMADLKNTGKGNLFVIFGEPDVTVTTGRWLVDKRGRMIGNYDQVLQASGCDSLEEMNQTGKEELLLRLDKASVWDKDEKLYLPSEGHIGAQLKMAMEALEGMNEKDFSLSLTEEEWTQVTIHGVDVYDPSKGEVRSSEPDKIACWFVDTNYDEESFFVRQAYFLGANEPYKALKRSLKAEINEEAWAGLRKNTSQPFAKPDSGRIAVKVINHLGDEAMRVFRV